ALDDGTGKSLNYVLAAIVVSGCVQVILGLFKLGKFADLFHSTIIHGILAAIGVIIIAKQIHIAMGTVSSEGSAIHTLLDAVYKIPDINPFVIVISIACLLVLIFHSRISYKLFHFLPAPMWVLFIAIPFVYLFDFFDPQTFSFVGKEYYIGPELLINIPDNILDSIIHPDFSRINSLPFWTSVASITMIASIESLASGKAIDKLDPYKRRTDLNKDLVGVGLSTIVSGALGGLPIINVIVRSTVNVHNNAKTKWSNFYHGLLLIVFIFILAPVIQKVPLCALATLLVFTGYKLASPKVFKQIYKMGAEQLIFFVGTLTITLFTDLLVGLFGGLLLALLTHLLLANVPIPTFFRMIFNSGSRVVEQEDGSFTIRIKGIANFLATIEINNLLEQIPAGAKTKIDLSSARLIDHSIMEILYEFQRTHSYTDGTVDIIGYEQHVSSSQNKLAMKVMTASLQKLTPRQIKLKRVAHYNRWNFELHPDNQISYFRSFYFFKSRPVQSKLNRVYGEDGDILWEIVDVKFEEGAYMATEEYHTTLGMITFPFTFPKFVIEKKVITERFINLAAHKDIDYVLYNDFSDDFIVKVEDYDEMNEFLNDGMRKLVEESQVIHHIESNGEAVLLFIDNLRLAQIEDYKEIVRFTMELKDLILETQKVSV
ncbi:MAG: SulP family inorganic anion transporter, partial [Bacteroidia bacterium]|nr:SulP family inorganic anion transporter [Bacteroidia bacterium]